jgi:hypothetical protein
LTRKKRLAANKHQQGITSAAKLTVSGTNEKEKKIAEEKKEPEQTSYSYTKSGDKLNMGCAGFFALCFLLPGLSLAAAGSESIGGLIVCVAIGMIPLRYFLREIYSRSVVVTKNEVQYSQSGIFLKNKSWCEPLANYSDIIYMSVDDNTDTVLYHSWNDSKNVVVNSAYKREHWEIDHQRAQLERLLKDTAYGTKKKFVGLTENDGFADTSFFEAFNRTKDNAPSILKLLLPDDHLRLMQDESGVFMVGINKGIKVFMTGLICLTLSFLLFPWVFRIAAFTDLAFWLHITGILLFNFGSTEQVLKLEKRSLTISRRWFRRRMVEQEHVAFADIISVEVQKADAAANTPELYFLRIGTIGASYEFAMSRHKQELEWLAGAVVDRIIKLNETYTRPLDEV